MTVDTTFDFRSDTPAGKDPDTYSPTLKKYHQLLWSRPLPNGSPFGSLSKLAVCIFTMTHTWASSSLGATRSSSPTRTRPGLLSTTCRRGTGRCSGTSGTPSAACWSSRGIRSIASGRSTLPWAASEIADRFDLTLECIRRYYLREPHTNPLREVLARYADFFALYGDFSGYVDYFLLQDLVSADGSIRFFTDFHDFAMPAIPQDVATYVEYRRRSVDFVHARNKRIEALGL